MFFRKPKADDAKPKENRKRVREFFNRHKEKIKQAARVSALSAMLIAGSISPPKPLEVHTYKGANKEQVEKALDAKGFSWGDKNYLFEILDASQGRFVWEKRVGYPHSPASAADRILEIALNEKFGEDALDLLGIVAIDMEGERLGDAIAAFRMLAGRQNPSGAVRAALEWHNAHGGDPVSDFMDFANYEGVGIPLVREVKESPMLNQAEVLRGLAALGENPNFAGRLDFETARGLQGILNWLPSAYMNEAGWIYPALLTYYSNPNFSPGGRLDMQEVGEFCLRAKTTYGLIAERGASDLILAMPSDPEFSAKKLDGKLAKRAKRMFDGIAGEKGKYGICRMRHMFRGAVAGLCGEKAFLPIYMDLFTGDARRDSYAMDAEYALMQALDNPIETVKMMGRVYYEAKALSKKVGAEQSVATWINFAYAYAVLGPEEAERMRTEFGVENFLRYSDSNNSYGDPMDENVLGIMARNARAGRGGSPVLLLATNRSDWNGAFTEMGDADRNFRGVFRVMFIEAGTDKELIERIENIGRRYGNIGIMFLGGHGDPATIKLGEGEGRAKYLDGSDYKKLESVRWAFTKKPLVILNSCSTGAWKKGGIGDIVRNALGADVIAPKIPTALLKVEYNPQNGAVTATYDGDAGVSRFFGAKPEKPPNPPYELAKDVRDFLMREGMRATGSGIGIPGGCGGSGEECAAILQQQEQERMMNLVLLSQQTATNTTLLLMGWGGGLL